MTPFPTTGSMVMLRQTLFPLALCAAALACASSHAGEIIFETRATNTQVTPWDALGSWNAQTSPISASELLEFTNISTPGSHHHSRLSFEFDAGGATNWDFQFGLDAGLGAAIYLNGELHSAHSGGLWWGYDWNVSGQLLHLAGSLFMDGLNTVEVYWAENCCAGAQSARFRTDQGAWQTLSTANLNRTAVPEPASLALLSIGLIGATVARRRQTKSPR